MGGEREVEIAKSDIKSKETSFGNFRAHLNNGEIHFHDDTNKLKSAIPVAKAWKIWDKLSSELGEVKHVDTVNKTVLTLASMIVPETQTLEVVAFVTAVGIGSNFKKLSELFKK
jgi:hypothetical protein